MKKLLTRIVGATLGLALAIGVSVGVANNREAKEVSADSTYSYTFTSKQFTANDQTKDLGGVSWTADGSGASWNYDATKGQQFGSGSAPSRDLTLTTSGITGTISSIVVYASTANSATANINCTVGGDAFGTQSQSLTNTNSSYTFSGSASGEIVINLKQPSTSKALYIKSLSVAYDNGTTVVGIAKKTAPTQTIYCAGEVFDPSGLVITLSYDDDSETDVAYNDHRDDFSCSPSTITAAGNVEITYLDYTSMKVTQAVTMATPYTVPEAIDAIDDANGDTITNSYVSGIISQIDGYNSTYHSITYWISQDGTTPDLEVYSGKGIGGANFNSENDLSVGDQVIVRGNLKKYNDIYEFTSNSRLISRTVPPRINSISLTPNVVDVEPNASGDVDLLFTSIVIDQNESSHKEVNDIDWSSDDENVIRITDGAYLVTGSHKDSTTIRAFIGGNEYGHATVTVIDPTVYVMSYDLPCWMIVDDPSTLGVGDKVILTGIKDATIYAAGTYSSGNNLPADKDHTLMADGNKVTGVVDTMIYTLEAGTANGSIAFKDSTGKYLYAAGGTNNNYLKSQASKDGNASFVLNANGTVVAQGTSTHNYMRYNNDGTSNLFNCYTSTGTTGTLVTFYKLTAESKGIDLPSFAEITAAYDDGNEAYIRLGVQLSEDDWDAIDSEIGITGYGVMLIRQTTLTTSGFSSIKEVYNSSANNKPNLKDLSRESNVAPQDHFIAAKISITDNNNIDVVFRAAPYVISNNGTYCFINEVSGSLYDLI